MTAPVFTTTIARITAISDELLVNRDGDTALQRTSDLAMQLATNGAVATALDNVQSGLSAEIAAVDNKVEAAAEGYIVAISWATLASVSGNRVGQPGRVTASDTGTHTDPVAGGTVLNSGEYVWSASPVGWRRVGDVIDAAALAEANGTWNIQKTGSGEFLVTDQAGFVSFRAGSQGVGFGTGFVRPIADPRVIVTDEIGWISGEIGGTGSGDGSVGSDIFSDAEIQAHNARALAMSSVGMNAMNSYTVRLQYDLNHVIEYGQSLSIATEAWPAKSKAAFFGNVSFGQSVLPVNLSLPTFEPHGSAALYPLTAKVQQGATLLTDEQVAALSPGDAATGEQISIGFANFAKLLHNMQNGVANDEDRTFVVSSCGRGGQTIAQLSKGADPHYFGRLPDVAAKVKAVADAGSKTYGIAAVLWEQGENDYTSGTTKADYKAAFIQLLEDIKTDVVEDVSGQSRMPIVLTYQTSGGFASDATELAIANAQLELSNELQGVFMYGPAYPVTDKGGHLSADGSRWLGMQAAKVFHRVVTLGLGWKPLQPLRAVIRSRQILIEHHVPKPPLVFKSPYVGFTATDYPNKGYRVTDDNGTVGISSVQIAADAVVKVILVRDTVGTVKIWYADKSIHNGNGCLADSDDALSPFNYEYDANTGDYAEANIAALVSNPYPLNNWCVSYVMTAQPK